MTKEKKTKKDAHLWARDPDDWYVEPSWCDDALFAMEEFEGPIADPSCGLGRILDAAKRAGYETIGRDIRDRGAEARHPFRIANFLESGETFKNICSNPPYLHSDVFAAECIKRAVKVALLLRAQWVNAGARSRWLESLPLKRVLALTPRPSMPPGAVIVARNGKDPSGGQQDYSWFIFERGHVGPPTFGWARKASKNKQPGLFE